MVVPFTPTWESPILVTGGGGFIGSHLVRLLLGQGYPVRVLELPAAVLNHLPRRRLDVVRGDIRCPAEVARAVSGCQVVLHLAANPNLWARGPAEFEEVNHLGTRNVLAACAKHEVARVVHVSTESILTCASDPVVTEATDPLLEEMPGPYCRSKLLAEWEVVRAARRGLPVLTVSPTVPVGPGDWNCGPMSRVIQQFAEGRIRGCLDGYVNLIDVRDAAEGIWAAALHGKVGERYLLAGERWSFQRLFEVLSRLTGRPAPNWHVPYRLALAYAWLEEKWCGLTGRRPMATVTGVRLTRRTFNFDDSRSRRELGLRRRLTIEALSDALEWFVAQGMIRQPQPGRVGLPRRRPVVPALARGAHGTKQVAQSPSREAEAPSWS